MERVSVQNNKLLWWMMGIIGSVLLLLSGSWANSMYNSVERVDNTLKQQGTTLAASLAELSKELRVIQTQHLERIVRLETQSLSSREEMSRLSIQLVRIEGKVDDVREKIK